MDRFDAAQAAQDAAWLLGTGRTAVALTIMAELPDVIRRAVELARLQTATEAASGLTQSVDTVGRRQRHLWRLAEEPEGGVSCVCVARLGPLPCARHTQYQPHP